MDEFPCCPHWTKNTREVLAQPAKNIDPDHIVRFEAVTERFGLNGIFKNVVDEAIDVY
ncbi:uncharacterized protein LY79DRAFT_671119 [Colletotrichum navitas]|uniref:Uncharacterized protein n=1 Tax=Colletotrichum navitas TaxID=681940 RepID=A0AAD8PWZ7_9PEZI|nr:uncharacterized protein LY79DRAFT_671119 [Colletotrichum navitas]KAK1585348.1 hypothetical protein LY79DRAFT_671119 [Colletotrichum navitas]